MSPAAGSSLGATWGLAAGLLAPWALVGFALLPLLWWLYRRRPRFPLLVVPSLQFFTEASGELVRRQRRRLDRDLVLALGAAAALVLAAAGPLLRTAAPGRHVRVVVAGGAPAAQRGYAEGVARTVAAIERGLERGERLEVLHVPDEAGRGVRPGAAVLLAAARAGRPDLAIELSDVVVEAPDVRSVALGDPTVANVGIVAADLADDGPAARLLVTILNDSPRPARPRLSIRLGEGPAARELQNDELPLGPGEVRSVLVAVPADAQELRAALAAPQGDALAADDVVVLRRRRLRVAFDVALSAAHRQAVERALAASLGSAGFAEGVPADLRIERWGGPVVEAGGEAGAGPARLRLVVLDPDEGGVPVPPGTDLVSPHLLTRDLYTAGLGLVVRAGGPAHAHPLLRRLPAPAAPAWDLLVGNARDVTLLFDVLRGSPAPAGEPFWPLLVDNFVRGVVGEVGEVGEVSGGGAGAHREGLLDAASTRLGRLAQPVDPAWLAPGPRKPAQVAWTAAPWLAGLGLGLLLFLWLREARRARVIRYA